MDFRLEVVVVPVPDVDRAKAFKHIFFGDPDGNRWTVQEIRP